MHIGVSPPEESIKVRQLVFPHSFFFFFQAFNIVKLKMESTSYTSHFNLVL